MGGFVHDDVRGVHDVLESDRVFIMF